MNLSKLISNKLLKDTFIYGFTNALYTGLPLILLPFLVVVLEPEDYGMLDLFRTISMFMVPFLGLSTVQSIGRFYFDLDNDTFKKFVSSIQIFQIFTSILAVIIVLLIAPWLDKNLVVLLLLSISYFLFNQFCESLLVIFRVNHKAKKYMTIRIINIVLELSLLLGFYIVLTHLNWTFRVFPSVISTVLVAIICGVIFWKMGYRPFFSKKLIKQALVYSSPLILHMVSAYMLNIGDRFFIKYYLNEKELGNYAVAYQIGMAVNFFYTSFNLAWAPTYFKWMKENKLRAIAKVKKIVYSGLIFFGIMNLMIWFIVSSYLKQHTNYEISTHIVIVILIGNIIFSLYKFEANYFFYSKKTKRLSVFTLISAIIAILLNVILIPQIGILGSAYATLFSFIVIFLLVTIMRRRELKYY